MPTMNNLKPTSSAARPARLLRLAAVAALLGGAAVGALAQYKIVGPDGKVTYTDKPPTASDIRMPPKGSDAAPANTGGMPYETRQAMSRFPVSLYTTKNCAPCDSARQALRQRGVPFNEFSVATDNDVAVYKSRFNSTTFPGISVGGKSLSGYSSTDLSGYLDAAGYPAQARLAGYSWPPAVALAPPSPAAPISANTDQPAATPSAPAPPPPSKSGIQF
jgi:glutaredoxin